MLWGKRTVSVVFYVKIIPIVDKPGGEQPLIFWAAKDFHFYELARWP